MTREGASPPRVSVVVPCYNQSRYLGEALDAILSQTFSDLEVIVVDDGSSDGCRELIEEYAEKDPRVRPLFHERNTGVSRSRNDGVAAAEGEFVAFCDADDVWMSEKLELQVRELTDNPGCSLVFCDAEIIDETGDRLGERFSERFPVPGKSGESLRQRLCLTNFINTQTVVVRRETLGADLRFCEKIDFGEDWHLWIRVAEAGNLAYLNRPLALYRLHGESTAVTERDGYNVDRVKILHYVIRNIESLPRRVRSKIFYNLGVSLSALGKRLFARRFFLSAVGESPANWRAWIRLLAVSCGVSGRREEAISVRRRSARREHLVSNV